MCIRDRPHTLAPAGPVGTGGERLAPPVRRQPPLTAELHERRGTGHHGDPARQRQIALTTAQRLRRQVQRDQRRRARGVHRHRRPLQTERVGHPAGRHTARAAADQVPLGLLRRPGRLVQAGAVVAVHHAGEDAGARAAQRGGCHPGPLEGLPRRLQQQPLLRIGGQGFPRAHPEELGVEVAGVVQEAALTGVRGAERLRVRVVEGGQVPAAVGGERSDGVGTGGDELPQVLRRGHASGIAAGHGDDRDRVVAGGHRGRSRRCLGGGPRPAQLREQPFAQGARRGVVEDQGGGQSQAGGGAQPVAEFDGGERVEAQVAEGPVAGHGPAVGVPEDGGHRRAHQLQHLAFRLGGRQRGQAGGR